jgi:ribosomal protein L16/L10AE
MFSLSSISRRLGGLGGGLARSALPSTRHTVETALSPLSIFTRGRAILAPKQVKNVKRHKGRVPIPIGGSTKGTTLAYGEWGIRIKGNGARLTAKQLTTARDVILKKLKILKGSKVYLRVFPDIPVCIKVWHMFSFCVDEAQLNLSRAMKRVWVKERERSNTGLLGLSVHVHSAESG